MLVGLKYGRRQPKEKDKGRSKMEWEPEAGE
jgi:hypothetical protein